MGKPSQIPNRINTNEIRWLNVLDLGEPIDTLRNTISCVLHFLVFPCETGLLRKTHGNDDFIGLAPITHLELCGFT
jgi:hypothetical protein